MRFKDMNDLERRKFVIKRKMQAEKIADFWKGISQRLQDNKDFKPAEFDLIDTILEKELPAMKEYSKIKVEKEQ